MMGAAEQYDGEVQAWEEEHHGRQQVRDVVTEISTPGAETALFRMVSNKSGQDV